MLQENFLESIGNSANTGNSEIQHRYKNDALKHSPKNIFFLTRYKISWGP
jgi:hypothetical protein